jgi:hypothetical protein
MSDIFVPASLSTADSVLNLAESLTKLLDPKERAKIADDIKAHHALNETEAKKSAEARALMKQHQDVLAENKKISEQNKADKDTLEQEKKDFNANCEIEKKKVSDKWSDVNLAAQTAKDLHDKAEGMINNVAGREEELRKAKLSHAIEVQKVSDKDKAAEATLKKAEEIKKQHTELLESIKTKQAAIAAFNI